jgi:ATP-binding cassette subfamily B (MDR/TAP) protein 1
VQEDDSKPPFDDGHDKGPAHIEIQDVGFAYESRPHAKVLEGIDVDVCTGCFFSKIVLMLITNRCAQVSSSL